MSSLEKLNEILRREQKNQALSKRALRLGARSKQRDFIAERDAQQEAAKDRQRRLSAALADERLDAQRFRFYFEHIETSLSIDEQRRWIDSQIVKSGSAKTA